jgi:hypothetical protein
LTFVQDFELWGEEAGDFRHGQGDTTVDDINVGQVVFRFGGGYVVDLMPHVSRLWLRGLRNFDLG